MSEPNPVGAVLSAAHVTGTAVARGFRRATCTARFKTAAPFNEQWHLYLYKEKGSSGASGEFHLHYHNQHIEKVDIKGKYSARKQDGSNISVTLHTDSYYRSWGHGSSNPFAEYGEEIVNFGHTVVKVMDESNVCNATMHLAVMDLKAYLATPLAYEKSGASFTELFRDSRAEVRINDVPVVEHGAIVRVLPTMTLHASHDEE